jgi:hypothetical protein
MQVQEMARDKQINFRVTEEEAKRFDEVAEHLGLSLASMIRSLVKEKHNTLTVATAPARHSISQVPYSVELPDGELVSIEEEGKLTKQGGLPKLVLRGQTYRIKSSRRRPDGFEPRKDTVILSNDGEYLTWAPEK